MVRPPQQLPHPPLIATPTATPLTATNSINASGKKRSKRSRKARRKGERQAYASLTKTRRLSFEFAAKTLKSMPMRSQRELSKRLFKNKLKRK
jgi:hypothetical protein